MARKWVNFIGKITSQDRVIENLIDIKEEVTKYFENLYEFRDVSRLKELNCGLSKLDGEATTALETLFTEAKI